MLWAESNAGTPECREKKALRSAFCSRYLLCSYISLHACTTWAQSTIITNESGKGALVALVAHSQKEVRSLGVLFFEKDYLT